jgi:hypothetical protein
LSHWCLGVIVLTITIYIFLMLFALNPFWKKTKPSVSYVIKLRFYPWLSQNANFCHS